MINITPEIQQQWTALAPYLTITNEQEYDLAVERLNLLLDEVGDDESHPLYSLLDTLGILIESYDNEHYPLTDCHGIDALIYLMDEHSLSQSDLPEIGSQGVVSEILNGKRQLNVRQIQALADKFQVSTATFFP
ncbi:putative transcription regulator with HTH domain protein [Hyella patelloides LEGE 07179]|uniref:Putative transcription regulator with HTH domain protein n=1 Tax=Hyella patelloides LEGE 07179 TaxID=945734 RepID=A0A563W2Y5_9CYAN|nr:helix-turn-helix domain-containing protein [Hyella patelloides]VEP18069.1 putative transcription regulator with HTH domain protein [Hyella patelloides LEGE 07179]